MKISEIITDKYKLRIPPTVYYDLLADVQEVEEKQEPCGDAISRDAVIEHYNSGEILQCNHVSRNNLLNYIEGLPSIQPTAKENLVVENCISREAVKEFVEYIQTIKDKHNVEGSPINYGTICDLVIRGWKLVESEDKE